MYRNSFDCFKKVGLYKVFNCYTSQVCVKAMSFKKVVLVGILSRMFSRRNFDKKKAGISFAGKQENVCQKK
jgi:hypothetical protein